ncbi:MAG: hypothetical protein AAGA64_13790 [Bacteroidota bacterium]
MDLKLITVRQELPRGFLESEKFALIIVPLETCEGCVNFLLNMAKDNIGSDSIKFIFFAQGPTKKIDILFTKGQVDGSSNIFFDKAGLTIKHKLGNSYYPMLYFVNNDHIEEEKVLKTETFIDDLNKIHTYFN